MPISRIPPQDCRFRADALRSALCRKPGAEALESYGPFDHDISSSKLLVVHLRDVSAIPTACYETVITGHRIPGHRMTKIRGAIHQVITFKSWQDYIVGKQ